MCVCVCVCVCIWVFGKLYKHYCFSRNCWLKKKKAISLILFSSGKYCLGIESLYTVWVSFAHREIMSRVPRTTQNVWSLCLCVVRGVWEINWKLQGERTWYTMLSLAEADLLKMGREELIMNLSIASNGALRTVISNRNYIIL